MRDVDLSLYPLDQAYITSSIFDGMNLFNKDISSALLCSSAFITANLEGADFCKSYVSYVDFTGANIKSARFADSECETVFVKADLSEANLVGGLFDEADFRNAILINVDKRLATFDGVLLNGSILSGIQGIEEAIINSINIGSPEQPLTLRCEEAKKWLQDNSLNKD